MHLLDERIGFYFSEEGEDQNNAVTTLRRLPTESLLDKMYNTLSSTMMTSKPVLIGLTKSTLKDRSINIIYEVRLACVTIIQDGLPSY